MKKLTHFIYITIIIVLVMMVWKKTGPTDEKSVSTVSIIQNSQAFYAYVKPNDPELYIVAEYRPDFEIRTLDNGISLPFIKETDHLIVGLQKMGNGRQWIWSGDDVPEGQYLLPLEDEEIPVIYKTAYMFYNGFQARETGLMSITALLGPEELMRMVVCQIGFF